MLVNSIKALGRTILGMLHTRMELLSLDIRELRLRFVSIMMLGACVFLFLTLGIMIGSLWLIVLFWETDRLLVTGILSASLLGGAGILTAVLAWKLKRDPSAFHGSMTELDKDREALGIITGRPS